MSFWLRTRAIVATGNRKIKYCAATIELLENNVILKSIVWHIVIWLLAMNIEIDCAVRRELMATWWVEREATDWAFERNCLGGNFFVADRRDERDFGQDEWRQLKAFRVNS